MSKAGIVCVALSMAASAQESDEEIVADMLGRAVTVPGATSRLPRVAREVVEPPNLPERLAKAKPVTLEMAMTINGGRSVRIITRTRDTVIVLMPDRKLEWYFNRNPVDPRRANGELVDHTNRTVLYHNNLELRDRGVARGWVDVMTVGLRLDYLDSMTATGETVEKYGLKFKRYVRDDSTPADHPVVEVWWNEELALPLKIDARDAHDSWQQDMHSFRIGYAESTLDDPIIRYPNYLHIDIADWGEEFHDKH